MDARLGEEGQSNTSLGKWSELRQTYQKRHASLTGGLLNLSISKKLDAKKLLSIVSGGQCEIRLTGRKWFPSSILGRWTSTKVCISLQISGYKRRKTPITGTRSGQMVLYHQSTPYSRLPFLMLPSKHQLHQEGPDTSAWQCLAFLRDWLASVGLRRMAFHFFQ